MRNIEDFFPIALVFVFLILSLPTASAKEIIVDDNSDANFRSIQEAVDNSVPWDTVIVRSGNYMEDVVINVTGLTIMQESENNDVQVKPLNENESIFHIKANNVTINGLKIIGNGETSNSPYGIRLENVNNCTIKGNIFRENRLGISLVNTSYNTISENSFFNNGISLDEGSGTNNLTDNYIENGYIIMGPHCSENLIAGNEISNGGGINIACCGNDNVVAGNAISNCSSGIDVYDQKLDIRDNRITDCSLGINLYSASETRIYNNTVLNCSIGINLGDACSSIDVFDNAIVSSAECGLFIPDNEGGERVYNNYFNNTLNVRVGIIGGNTWNNSLTRGTNIAGGPYIGGNFWAKPDGTGFSQISEDADENGIGDLPYKVNGSEFDYLPLVSISSLQNPLIPVSNENGTNSKIVQGPEDANFNANPTNGPAPLTVQFTASSVNATEWKWDFGDGATSTEKNPTHTYSKAGSYTASLEVTIANGTASKSATITVLKLTPTITWNNPEDIPYGTALSDTQLNAVASVPGTFTYTPATGTVLSVGTHTLRVDFTPDDTANYNTASKEVTINVIDSRITPTITWSNPANITYGTALSGTQLNAVASVPGSLTYNPAEGTVLNVGTHTLRVNFTPFDTANYKSTSNTVTINVIDSRITPTINWNNPADILYGTALSGTQLNAVASVPGTLTYNPAAGTLLSVGTHILRVDFTPTDNANYKNTSNTVTINVIGNVTQITPTITWNNPADITDVIALSSTQLNAVATDPVTGNTVTGNFVYTPAAGTLLDAGTYPLRVDFTPTDTANYTTASKEVTINVIDSGLPVADFRANPTSGYAPLYVQFTDHSEDAAGWNWSFGDGNTSIYKDPSHTYYKAENYNVSLTVNNANGTDSQYLNIAVQEPPNPIVSFTASPMSGNAPLSVKFTDTSRYATARSWDFNNDGVADSSDLSPVYTYATAGNYNVNLTVSNTNGTASKNATITVLIGSDSGSSGGGGSHSSGSGGGGGAGGSPEPQSNVAAKEISQTFVTSGNSAKFDFPRNATSVAYITFNSKKTAGKTTTIVEMLKGKSTLVIGLPSGEVYKSLNIWVGNSGFATPANIENSVICFKVEKSWIRDKNITQSSINLYRYNDKKWNQLQTSLLSEDSKYLYFTAQTPGFSPFAIASNSITNGTAIQPVTAGAKIQPENATYIQPGLSTKSAEVNNTKSEAEQKPKQEKNANLPVFGMICMIALVLVAFLFKIDKT